MGGGSKQTTQTHQQQNTSRSPYAPSIPGLESIIQGVNAMPNQGVVSSIEQGALDALAARAGQGNIWAPQIGNLATNLLSGFGGQVQGALDDYRAQLMPTISGQFLDPNTNPFFAQTTADLSDAAFDRVNAMYAGSGRDSSGAGSFAQNAGKGIGQATAPIYAQIYGDERARQLGAMGALYGGANTTAGLLGSLGHAGIGAATAAQQAIDAPQMALLNIEAQRRGIPLQDLAARSGLLLPIGQAFGSGSATTDATSTQQLQENPFKLALGGALGAAGIASGMGFNPMAMLGMGGGMAGFGGTAPGGGGGFGYNPMINAPNYPNPYPGTGGSWY